MGNEICNWETTSTPDGSLSVVTRPVHIQCPPPKTPGLHDKALGYRKATTERGV